MIEKAIVFGPDRSLVGVWTEPRDPMPGDGPPAVIIINSGIVHHAGIWRLHVRTARALAERGFSSLRFDLSGIGDSENPRDAISPDELARRDVDAAIHYARETRGIGRVVMMGLCSGAWDGLGAAIRNPSVAGVAAIDMIADLRTWQFVAVHFGKRLFRLESWKNTFSGKNGWIPTFVRWVFRRGGPDRGPDERYGARLGARPEMPKAHFGEVLSGLLGRNVEMLFVFSNGIEESYNHRSQFAEALPKIAAHPRLAIDFFPLADHTFIRPDQQQALIARVVGWMEKCFGMASPGSGRGK
jgi:pimeloyl-ACP methyl ester carboxylesterase